MDLEFLPPTKNELKRTAWFTEHAKPGMTMGEYQCLNGEVLRLFPLTAEERRQKFERWKAMPEFIL
jgi:hypothetical protein